MSYINTEAMERAAFTMSDAAEKMARAAGSLEDSTNRLTALLGQGYGNNIERLIELLEKQEATP